MPYNQFVIEHPCCIKGETSMIYSPLALPLAFVSSNRVHTASLSGLVHISTGVTGIVERLAVELLKEVRQFGGNVVIKKICVSISFSSSVV